MSHILSIRITEQMQAISTTLQKHQKRNMSLKVRITVTFLSMAILAEQCVVKGSEPAMRQEPGDNSCPLWLHPVDHNGTQSCQCDNHLQDTVYCNNRTQEVVLTTCYCMTTSKAEDIEVGKCIYNCGFTQSKADNMVENYIPLPKNISELNNQTCDHFNRQGRLCGQCKDDHYPPVYSYSLKCEKCTGSLNWLKYIIVAFLPQTLFFFFVVAFRISITTPQLNGYVCLAQTVSGPYTARPIVQFLDGEKSTLLGAKILLSLYGVWNLDFFRPLIPGICLQVTTLQALALEYVLAVYPLALTALCYAILQLYTCNFRLLNCLQQCADKCFVHFRDYMEARTSIIDAFATFLLLSYVKLLSVSFDLLYPTQVFNATGHSTGLYLFYDANVIYFGKQHLPYAIVALVVVVVFILLLLLVYPMRYFQRLLGKCGVQSQALRTFMESFQGCYKDGLDGSQYDSRYFPAMSLILRILGFISYSFTLDITCWAIDAILILLFAIAIIIIKPYKEKYSQYNIIEATLMLTYVAWIILVLCADLTTIKSVKTVQIYHGIGSFVAVLPLLYISVITAKWIITRKKVKTKLRKILHICKHRNHYEEIEGDNSFFVEIDQRNQLVEAANFSNASNSRDNLNEVHS